MAESPDRLIEIRDGFFLECDDLLEQLTDALNAPGFGQPGDGLVHDAFRAVHSIKGGAAAFGLTELADFAHRLESDLDALRRPAARLAAGQDAALMRAADQLARLVAAARTGETPGPVPTGPLPAQGPWHLRFTPDASLYQSGNEPLHLLNALADLDAVSIACEMGALPMLASLRPEAGYLTWAVILPGHVAEAAIREIFEFVEDLCKLTIRRDTIRPVPDPVVPDPVASAPPLMPAATVRVDLSRVDRLMDLIGELNIGQSMLAQALSREDGSALSRRSPVATALDTQAGLIRALQDAAITIRSQSLKPLFQRMSRLLRELSDGLRKPVELHCIGEATEVDRNVIERLADPLTHMIRNAIDHGIEAPDERAAAGKPPVGRVTLSATQRSGRIVIELADDGGGIRRDRVRSLAIGRGLIAPDAVLSDEETDALLFRPGFSTQAAVTMVSGRGVGLDVVRSAILALGGRIAIRSQPGVGTSFSLSLPLTLAVLEGMILRAGDQTYVLPHAAVLETAIVPADALHRADGRAALICLRDQFVSVCDVAATLGRPSDAARHRPIAILVSDDNDRRAALIVDQIIDKKQVVIKGIRQNCGAIPGISAATILGDGRIALILDPTALIDMAGAGDTGARALEPVVAS